MALTGPEKEQLARRISRGVQVVCSSIAQLHLTSPDPKASAAQDETGIIESLRSFGADQWKFTNIEGALLLTKDQQNICHFRIYDLEEFKLRFQYELYENLDYQKLNELVHSFEMENCVCGFSFSSQKVAQKFYERVQNYITRTTAPAPNYNSMLMSPGFSTPPPIPMKSAKNKKVNGSNKKRGTRNQNNNNNRSNTVANTDNLFMGNGMLDPNNVPDEWKSILKKAGIKKKDLKNPEMFNIIRDALAQQNIALDAPEMDMNDESLQHYYTKDQLAAWKKYNEEMEQYKIDQERYQRELDEYEKQKAQEEKLSRLMAQQPIHNNGKQGAQMLRQSVMKFQGRDIGNILPALAGIGPALMPRQSVARPALPALPVIPEAQKRGAQMAEARHSKVMIKAGFLGDIKKKDFALKHVSVLPTIKDIGAGAQNGLLSTLMDKLKEQRAAIKADDDDDEGSDFSDFVGE